MIALMENAMVERLQSASDLGILGYKLKTVSTYGGQLDDMDAVRRLAHALPACLVVCLGESLDTDMGGGHYRMKGRFAVLVLAHNSRNEQARRHGAAGSVGTYQLRRDVRMLLSDQSLGLGQGYLVPEGTKSFFTGIFDDLEFSVLSVEFSTTWVEESSGQHADVPARLTPEMVEAARPLTPGVPPAPATLFAAALGLAPFRRIYAGWLAPCCVGKSSTKVTFEGENYGKPVS
ncbi:MAG: phage protein Gp37 [Desulfovibrionaceae bacterium]